jgi:protein ImuB
VSSPATRMLVAEVADWPVAAAGYREDQEVVVVHANLVVAASEAARQAGVREGMRRREAQRRCPEVTLVAFDAGRDARQWEPVVAAVEEITPGVEVAAPGLVALATRGPSRYFGGDDRLAATVATAVDVATGRWCRVGVADGRLAALLAARRRQGGDRATVVKPGDSREFLAPWPVEVLGRPELADLLVRLGLRTLGDLAALPAPAVLARFGTDGAAAHRLARGLDERPLAARTPPPDMTVTVELDPPAERVDAAAFAGKALADRLHARLGERGWACTVVAIEAQTDHGETLVRRWRHDGALTPAAISDRVRWQLDGWISSGRTTAGVTLLRLRPEEICLDHGRQLDLWGVAAASDDRAARGLARVHGMLGPQGVSTVVLVGGRDPASQVRLVPWGDLRPPAPATPGAAHRGAPSSTRGGRGSDPASRRRSEPAPWPGRLPDPAPAVVYGRPLAVDVLDADGHPVTVTGRGVAAAAPAVLVTGGTPAAVEAWAGPWPAEQRWWDSDASRRARFQLAVTGGAVHLVARRGGRWWLEATYD